MLLILKRLFFILVTIGYMAFIWIQSSYFDPASLVGFSSSVSQSIFLLIGAAFEFAHLFQFGLLYFCIVIVFLSYGRLQTWQETVAALVALSYGIADEIHQLYVPFRSFSIADLIKDSLGVWVFWLIVHQNYFINSKSKIGHWLRNIE